MEKDMLKKENMLLEATIKLERLIGPYGDYTQRPVGRFGNG